VSRKYSLKAPPNANAPYSPNGAQALFLLETATESEPARFAWVIRLFGDADEEARTLARTEWKAAKEAGEVSYWRQDASGAWKKAA
jgi:DNA polymerase-3 subunit chi